MVNWKQCPYPSFARLSCLQPTAYSPKPKAQSPKPEVPHPSRPQPVFSPDRLLQPLSRLPGTDRYWVAFSGGLDSTVLLHALARLRDRLGRVLVQAVHVNHGLHDESGQWVRHCQQVCAALDVPCRSLAVDATPAPGESPEAAARHARYGAIAALVERGDVVLAAHHRDDQAETVLLSLLRGSGPHGLAGMPQCRALGHAWLARPLLGFPRAALRAYAEAQGLGWVDDPSNREDRYQRNFLRNEVLPLVRTRWPEAVEVMARSAAHLRGAAGLLDELAEADLGRVRGPSADTVSVSALRGLSRERQDNLLRYWVRGLGLPVPGSRHLAHIISDAVPAAPDAVPLVHWPGAEVRRYRDRLYAMTPPVPPPANAVAWCPPDPLTLAHGVLEALPARGRGLRVTACTGRPMEVRFRRGGERCRLPGRSGRQMLKKLLQEHGVPPWARDRIPLVYADGELAAVADLWICEPFAAAGDEEGWVLRWQETLPGIVNDDL